MFCLLKMLCYILLGHSRAVCVPNLQNYKFASLVVSSVPVILLKEEKSLQDGTWHTNQGLSQGNALSVNFLNKTSSAECKCVCLFCIWFPLVVF